MIRKRYRIFLVVGVILFAMMRIPGEISMREVDGIFFSSNESIMVAVGAGKNIILESKTAAFPLHLFQFNTDLWLAIIPGNDRTTFFRGFENKTSTLSAVMLKISKCQGKITGCYIFLLLQCASYRASTQSF